MILVKLTPSRPIYILAVGVARRFSRSTAKHHRLIKIKDFSQFICFFTKIKDFSRPGILFFKFKTFPVFKDPWPWEVEQSALNPTP